MVDFPVSPEKAKALQERMAAFEIKEEDLEETFTRSGGKGGQNVNKVATCVILLHRPTGTLVRCEQERSQGLNRYLARKRLVDKIEQKILGDASTQRQAIEKIRRQKRKRSARAKEKMLRDKKIRSEVKELRKPVDIDEE